MEAGFAFAEVTSGRQGQTCLNRADRCFEIEVERFNRAVCPGEMISQLLHCIFAVALEQTVGDSCMPVLQL